MTPSCLMPRLVGIMCKSKNLTRSLTNIRCVRCSRTVCAFAANPCSAAAPKIVGPPLLASQPHLQGIKGAAKNLPRASKCSEQPGHESISLVPCLPQTITPGSWWALRRYGTPTKASSSNKHWAQQLHVANRAAGRCQSKQSAIGITKGTNVFAASKAPSCIDDGPGSRSASVFSGGGAAVPKSTAVPATPNSERNVISSFLSPDSKWQRETLESSVSSGSEVGK